jgi:hypothetical protein
MKKKTDAQIGIWRTWMRATQASSEGLGGHVGELHDAAMVTPMEMNGAQFRGER